MNKIVSNFFKTWTSPEGHSLIIQICVDDGIHIVKGRMLTENYDIEAAAPYTEGTLEEAQRILKHLEVRYMHSILMDIYKNLEG